MTEKSLTVAPVMAPVPEQKWTKQDVDIMRESLASGLTDEQFKLYLASAKARNLNPLAGQIHGVAYQGKMVLQTGIDGQRTIAQRTGNYGGSCNARLLVRLADGSKQIVPHDEYDPDEHVEIISASIDVRFRDGNPPQTATAVFKRYAKYYNGKLGSMWEKMPDVMILKCAEAKALRQAFPEPMMGLYIHEEMRQAGATDVEFRTVERGILRPEDLKPGKPEDRVPVEAPQTATLFPDADAADIRLEEIADAALPDGCVDSTHWKDTRNLILKYHKVESPLDLTESQWSDMAKTLVSAKFKKELQAENLLPMER